VAPRDFDTPPGANFWFQQPLNPQGVAHLLASVIPAYRAARLDPSHVLRVE
jgi:hypothetical protein